ncbi:MAG: FtsW/RodA/SpoVE family cell cycle protein [bacterium]
MTTILVSSFLLNIFSFFNLLGINKTFAFAQLSFFIIALIIFVIGKILGIEYFKKNYKFFYWMFIFLLLFTFIIGDVIRGSKRWISLYFFNFQPSEFFKIFFIIFLSKIISQNENDIEKRSFVIKILLYLALPFFIVFKQPDLGNALSYIAIMVLILLFSKIPKKYIFNLFLIFILILPLGWNILKDYQKNRVVSFFIAQEGTQGSNYNMIQSKIAAGSGKFLGRGLGYGTQSKLFFLPESHTDFAFSSLTEQFGFIGGFLIILLYFLICINLIKIIMKFYLRGTSEDRFYLYYCVGLLGYLSFQIFVNIAMNLGSFPITGVSLPIISYGGSSLLTFALGIALLPSNKV